MNYKAVFIALFMNESTKPNTFWEFLKAIVISLLIVIPIRAYVAQPFIVDGASMEPAFHGGEYLIIDEISYALREPKRGEVIVFRFPLRPSQFFIKRIIALPGETVDIRDSVVTITASDGKSFVLPEEYIASNVHTAPNVEHVVLGPEQYYVMGDNREHSSDSRIWGALPRSFMMGKVWVRLLPIPSFSVF